MKKLFLLLLCATHFLFSQNKYETGYIIKKNLEKIDCLIYDEDWKNNPTDFQYKENINSEVKVGSLDDIKEFATNEKKYLNEEILFDTSSDLLSEMKREKNPIYEKRRVFLRELVNGFATLYSYSIENSSKFFYKKENNIIPLVYKRYLIVNKLMINEEYKNQLKKEFICNQIDYSNIQFNKSSLIKTFEKINSCNGSDFTTNFKTKKININFSPKLGLISANFSANNSNSFYPKNNYENKLLQTFGFELEFILPYNNDKWAIVTSPNFYNYKANVEATPIYSDVTISNVEIPIGLRHYFFINENHKISLTGYYIIDKNKSSDKINFDVINDIELNTKNGLKISVAYNYKKGFIEISHRPNSRVSEAWETIFNYTGISIGYKLF